MLSHAIMHKDRRASMASRCSKTITQYKFDLMAMTIAIAQDTARGYAQLAIDTKNKLCQLDNNSLRTSIEQLIQAIEIRGENMKKRAQELFQYKMISFFEQAPAVDNGCLEDHRVQLIKPCEKEGFPCLKRILYEFQSKKLPHQLNIRARREQKVIRSIRKILRHRPDITVRRTDNSKVFYAGNVTIFGDKASKYMIETEAYQEISNERWILSENLQLVTMLLASLLENRAINHEQHKKMSPKIDSLELAHLHFIPKPHKVTAIHAPATEISKFLNDLLAPIFLRVSRQTTFINGSDLVRALEKYVANGYLKPTTLFITFDVENLYTMIPRQGVLEVLL
ncbi:unnamed protein product, partial [Rotaria sordida]